MIQLGSYNTLRILRSTRVGLFLGDEDGTEVLLPNKYVPQDFEIDDTIRVFCYLDHEERPIATTLEPFVLRDGFASLLVKEVGTFGAFLDWGLEKHLLVPYREQRTPMEEGKSYLVHCYLDQESFRLVGSSRLNRFLSNDDLDLKVNEEVALKIYRKTPLGWEVVINDKHLGLIFDSDVFRPLHSGEKLTGYIKQVRPDNKLDVALQPIGASMLEPTASQIYEKLKANNGFLPLHDKSSPEEIKAALHLSKKAFKKGIGGLYKAKKILIKEDGIYLNQA